MLIRDNVYWIDTGRVNCYLCRDDDGYTLIDTGTPRQADAIFSALAAFGGHEAGLKRIILTHADLDHAGSAAEVLKRSGATVCAGAATAALLAEGRSPKHMPVIAQFVIDRFMRFERVATRLVMTLKDGDVLPVLGGLQALATPGHTPDHFSYYSPATGILFAGDALNTRQGRLQRSPHRITADEAAANESARRLLLLRPAIIACGHGAPLAIDEAGIEAFSGALYPTGDLSIHDAANALVARQRVECPQHGYSSIGEHDR